MKINWIYRSLNFWIKFCTFTDGPQMALIYCDAYKKDHIFSDYVSGFSLWLPEMCWPLQGWLACQNTYLYRSVQDYEFCSIHRPFKSQRYWDEFAALRSQIFEHESHELNEYFIAHGSHSHGFFTTSFLNTRFAVGPLTEGK